jgi:hypothetical protein
MAAVLSVTDCEQTSAPVGQNIDRFAFSETVTPAPKPSCLMLFYCQNREGRKMYQTLSLLSVNSNTGTQSLIRNSENRKAPKTESIFMEVDSNLNTTVTMTTMTTLMYPVPQDPQASCNVPLLYVYVQVYSLV